MTKTLAQLAVDVLRLERAQRDTAARVQAGATGGSGGVSGGNGVSGFSVDANGDLILTYAGAPSDVSIDGDGNLILEV